ncbi:hypothetical protein [Natronincola ferrireducens]|uniref:FecR family protein n=1 Tax=Natronincola ferrireducens TaxID=393762 RepID=A0A1G9GZB1_9FIRM|nr:hypothetical protein [Natronincola ferrireducens]SDL06007.1 hypothetical protein SAMN05660472_02536 [Natronincola ferrireducens]
MKKLVSLVLIFFLLAITPLYAFASDAEVESKSDTEIINMNGETMIVHKSENLSGDVTLEMLNNDSELAVLANNDTTVKVNGVEAIEINEGSIQIPEDAVIVPEDNGSDVGIQGRAYVAESDSPYSEYEFTNYRGGSYKSLRLYNVLKAISLSLLTSAIVYVCFVNPLAAAVAGAIIGAIPVAFQDSQALYYIENEWYHGQLGSLVKRYTQAYFFDKDYSPRYHIKDIAYHSIFI